MELKKKIESLLFASAKPLTLKRLAEILEAKKEEVKQAAEELIGEYDQRNGGVVIVRDGQKLQMMTSPNFSDLIKEYLHSEMTGELTRPSLETLTIIAYRQPATKAELEMIRGINCSLILRNLLIRGLIEAREDKQTGINRYRLTFDFMQYLGVKDVSELPDYGNLNKDINLEELLNQENKEE